jgi:hypothetical protein
VTIILQDDQLGGISAIEVSDNGHGIPYQDAEKLFSRLGGSWKQGGRQSLEKHRILHGKEGRGRFRAFALERVDIQDSGSARNLIQAPFRGALDVVGSVDAEGPAVGADAEALAGQAG